MSGSTSARGRAMGFFIEGKPILSLRKVALVSAEAGGVRPGELDLSQRCFRREELSGRGNAIQYAAVRGNNEPYGIGAGNADNFRGRRSPSRRAGASLGHQRQRAAERELVLSRRGLSGRRC